MAAIRALPMATNIVAMHKGAVLSHSCGSFVAIADQYGVDVYDTSDMDPQLDIRRQTIVFTTKTIPLQMRIADLQTLSRVTCIFLQPEFLWVGLHDGAVRVWNHKTGESVQSIQRQVSTRVPCYMNGNDYIVRIMWTNFTYTQYKIGKDVTSYSGSGKRRVLNYCMLPDNPNASDPSGFVSWRLLLTDSWQPLRTWEMFGSYTTIETTPRYELAYSSTLLQVASNLPGSGRVVSKSFENFSITAGTIADFDQTTCIFTSLLTADGASLLCRFDMDDECTLPGFTKKELAKTAKIKGGTITAMIMFQGMLALCVTTQVEGHVYLMCPRTFKIIHNIIMPNERINRSGVSILNAGQDSEALLILSGNFRVQMAAPPWKLYKTAMAYAVASSQKKEIRLPTELWFHLLRFL